MILKIIKILVLKTIFLCVSTVAAFAQAISAEEFPTMTLVELREALDDANSFRLLDQVGNLINGNDRCGTYLRDASDALQNMRQIRADSRGQVTETIQRAYQEQQDKNQVALFDYRACFTRNLANYPKLTAEGITSYEEHRQKFDVTKDNYSNVPNMDNYVLALENAIENYFAKTEGIGSALPDVVGVVDNIHRRVEVLPGGRGDRWIQLSKGYNLRLRDEVRTGPRGRARIAFADRYLKEDAGPTVINVGSDTHIKMETFALRFTDPKKREGVIELLKGTVRAFTQNWGFRSSFKVRTGTGGAGIRGTEASFDYDPNTDVFNVHVDHGDAFIEHNGQEIPVEPKTSRTVAFGNLSPPRPLNEEQWVGIVENTGDGFAETNETSRLATVNSPGIVVKQQDVSPATPFNADEEFRREMAKIYVSTFLESIKNYDEELYLGLVAGQIRTSYDTSIKTRTFREFVDGRGERPLNWTQQCAVCLNDDKNTCQVQVYVDAVDPAQSKSLIFWYEEDASKGIGRAISKAALAQGDDLMRFQSLNPVCIAN